MRIRNRNLLPFLLLGLSIGICGCARSTPTENNVQTDNIQTERETTQLLTGEATQITGIGNSVTINGNGAMETNGLIRITSGGIYDLHGDFQDFQVRIEAQKDDVVQINLNGVTMLNNTYAVINGVNCEKLILNSVDGTVNTLSDGVVYRLQSDDDEVNSVIFSKDDICLAGNGTLIINANYEDAVRSKDTLEILSGTYEVNSVYDAFQGKDELLIFDGNFSVNAGDDAFHAGNVLIINDGTIDITSCYEGIEGIEVIINGGAISVVASDDGINAAGGSDEGEEFFGKGGFGDVNEDAKVVINDGYVYINANGDGIDSNGMVEVNGGILLVDGPTNGGNGALDYAISANVNGGYVIAGGSAAMASGFSESSKQYSWHYQNDGMQGSKELLTVTNEAGEVLVSYQPSKEYQSVVISIPEFEKGSTYQLMLGGSVVEADKYGFSKQADISEAKLGGTVVIEHMVNGSPSGGFGGGFEGGFDHGFGGKGGKGNKGNRGDMPIPEDGERPERPEGMEPPQKPQGMEQNL